MANLLENYANPFDLDGQIKVQPGVTPARVKEANALVERARRSRVEEARLSELFTSSDLSPSLVHAMNLEIIPQLPEALEDEINGIAEYRIVKDFRPWVLRGLLAGGGVEGSGLDSRGAAVVVPEASPYSEVKLSGSEESFYSRLAKRGFRATVTFESIVDDILGQLDALPQEFLATTVNTIKAEIWDALDQAAQEIPAVALPDGTTTDPNPVLSVEGIVAAAVAIESREVNGIKIGAISAYNLFVPVGQKRFVEWQIAQYGRVITVQDGALTLGPDSTMQSLFPNVEIRETDRLTGTNWKLVPKPGTTKGRPALVRLGLRGYEQPELRVSNEGGTIISGGGRREGIWNVGVTADTAALRYRFITGAALLDDAFVGVSDGTGVA